MAKRKGSKILAGFLAFVMVIAMFPVNALATIFTETDGSYCIRLTDGMEVLALDDVEVILTDKEDNTKTAAAKTVAGIAAFENFVEEGATYLVAVGTVLGYKADENVEITVAAEETSSDIVLTAREKIMISGVVVDENNAPYEGATIKVSGHVTCETVTDTEGKYAFETYAGVENNIRVSPRADDKRHGEIPNNANYSRDTTDANYQLSEKTFSILTVGGENGTITESEEGIPYGADRVIHIEAAEDYCIETVSVIGANGNIDQNARNKKVHDIELNDIDSDYTISVSFYKATYTVSFDVKENGEVKYNTDQIAFGGMITDVAVEENGKVDFEAIANSDNGYHVETITIGDETVLANGGNADVTYAGTVTSDEIGVTINVTVVFTINEYNVTIGAVENGSVTLSDKDGGTGGAQVAIKHGDNVYVHVVPEDAYDLYEVKVGEVVANFAEASGTSYKTQGVPITSDTVVTASFSEKEPIQDGFYEMTLPDNSHIIGDTAYVAKGTTVAFVIANPELHKRVRVTYMKNDKECVSVGGSVSVVIGGENGAEKITGVAVSTDAICGGWTTTGQLNITLDDGNPTISEIENSGKWFSQTAAYSFTVNDSGSGVEAVKYAKTDDVTTATMLTADQEGRYNFSVSEEYDGSYYIWVTDHCGNTLRATADVKIDLKDPEITAYIFSTEEDKITDNRINYLSFGTFSDRDIYVTIKANDEAVSSGLNEITLYIDGRKAQTKKAGQEGTAVFTLTGEEFNNGKSISASVTDVSGRESKEFFPVDLGMNSNIVQITNAKPTVNITSEEGTLIEGKRWFNRNAAFKIDVTDTVVGIGKVSVKLNGEEILVDSNGDAINRDFSENRTNQISFVVNTALHPVDGENKIEVTVENNVWQKGNDTESIFLDTTEPDIIGYEITNIEGNLLDKILNFLTFGIFYNEQVKIAVTAEDKNASAGVESISLYLGDEKYTQTVDNNNKATFIVTAKELDENTSYAADISAIATDKVGNVTENPVFPTEVNSNIKDTTLMLENIDPTVRIVPTVPAAANKNPETADDKEWYADDVTFNVIAGDKDSGLREVIISINDQEVEREVFYNDDGTDTECREEKYTVNTKGIDRYEEEGELYGSYTVNVQVTDNAGNVKEDSYVVYKDVDAPQIVQFDFVPAEYIDGSEDIVDENGEPLVITTDYGFYFKHDTDVIITARDPGPTAGIKSITYYTVDFTDDLNGIETVETTCLVDNNNQIPPIKIRANFKGQIYAKATDNVLNAPEEFAHPNSTIVENGDKHDAEEHIAFAKRTAYFSTNDGTDLYDDDVDVTITVMDTYSGIREVEWSVVAPYDTEDNQSGKVTVDNDMSLIEETGNDLAQKEWVKTKTEVNLVTEMQKTIKVKNDSNNIIVTVKMTDRAGNTSEKNIEFSIDKTAPKVVVAYGSKEIHDDEYTDFFNTKRTATIIVTERNFRASDIVFEITNTDGVIPDIDLKDDDVWVTTVDQTDPDKTTHVAKIEYTVDGDYTFDIAYRDNAENPANTVEQNKFTIDMTAPQVIVAYNNNSALNGNYYNAGRTARITIKEHNFDAKRANVIGIATDGGRTVTFPTTSAWRDNGNDTHTATISYKADAKYVFDIEFRDKANNSIADYIAEEFYVDKTAPNLSITGVADKSANNGDIAPVITCSDTNFDRDAVTITLNGIHNGSDLKYSGAYADIANGQTYTYANFEKIQSVDDIYTLIAKVADLAGNETEVSITFSANRFGSVYDLTDLEDILGKYLQAEEDIVFTETNVDTIDRETVIIKLTKNGTPTDLVEGTDYTVEESGGNGQWSVYTYTIRKELFADDGRYTISIYSEDAAGNVNENIDERKAAEISFGIDKTNPVIVPIDFESGVQYAVDKKSVSVDIKDNLVLDGVKIYLNGKEVEYIVDGETYTFDILKDNQKQNVRIVAVDAAGNEEPAEITDFLVNANIFVRWYNNMPLFIGSIVGVVILTLGIAAFVIFGKKKKVGK